MLTYADVCRVVLAKPSVVILDESTSALGLGDEATIYRLLQALNITVLVCVWNYVVRARQRQRARQTERDRERERQRHTETETETEKGLCGGKDKRKVLGLRS